MAGSNDNELWRREVVVFLDSHDRKTHMTSPLLLSAMDRHQGKDVHPRITSVNDQRKPAMVCAGVAYVNPYFGRPGSLTVVTYTTHFHSPTRTVGQVERKVLSLVFTDDGVEKLDEDHDPSDQLATSENATLGLILR
jgi:hypothetical protein